MEYIFQIKKQNKCVSFCRGTNDEKIDIKKLFWCYK